jgi:hypothetical protein
MAAWLPCRPPSSTACRSRRGTSCRDDCHAIRIRCSSPSGAAAPASSPHGACHHGEEEQKCPWTPRVSTPTASPAPQPARASTGHRRAHHQPHRRSIQPTTAAVSVASRAAAPPPTAPPDARGPRAGESTPRRHLPGGTHSFAGTPPAAAVRGREREGVAGRRRLGFPPCRQRWATRGRERDGVHPPSICHIICINRINGLKMPSKIVSENGKTTK